jgi:putative spermidine/putrescine transport system ATP-binding protein
MDLSPRTFTTLRLDNVGRDFGQLKALSHLTLSIERGEFVALLGPSGCGKSTALNCVAGLLPTTHGSIWLDDRRIDTLSPEQRGFGMVFQSYALFPHMSVRKNIGFGLRMRGIPKAEAARRIEAAIAMVRLTAQADKLPGQLSGGQQQRVAIARAIVVEPALVLMDEPLSNLDAKLRLEMRQEIRRIHAGLGAITVYVTHDQDEALSMADRIVVMRDGRIRQVGTPQDLYLRPVDLDVADFMGFRNKIAARVIGVAGDQVRLEIGRCKLIGTSREAIVGGTVVAAVRPEDLVPIEENGASVPATVEACEYRGRNYFGSAKGPEDAELFFRSDRRFDPGSEIHLGAQADRILVYNA